MRVVSCELKVETDTMPISASWGGPQDRVVTARRIWADLRVLFDEEDMVDVRSLADIKTRLEGIWNAPRVQAAVKAEFAEARRRYEEES